MTLRIAEQYFTTNRQLQPLPPEAAPAFQKAALAALTELDATPLGHRLLEEIRQAGPEVLIVKNGPGVENMCTQKVQDDNAFNAASYREVLSVGVLRSKLDTLLEAKTIPADHPSRRKYTKFHGEQSVYRIPIDKDRKAPIAHKEKGSLTHSSETTLRTNLKFAAFDGDMGDVNKTVTRIGYLQNGLVAYHVMEHLTPGSGADVFVVWDPALEDTGAKLPPGDQAAWMRRPAWLGLAHELIHAWRVVTGRCVFRPTPFSEEYYEEAMTVGLPPYDRCPITENRLRQARGLATRSYYGSKTQAQSVAAQKKHGSVEERLKINA
jgi:hypothetical protein